MDVTDFQYLEAEDLTALDLNVGRKSVIEFNTKRLKEAAEFCIGCPMQELCLKTANDSDLFWTVRGGQLPTRITRKQTTRRSPYAETSDYLPMLCRKGHSEFAANFKGKMTCVICSEDQIQSWKRIRERRAQSGQELSQPKPPKVKPRKANPIPDGWSSRCGAGWGESWNA